MGNTDRISFLIRHRLVGGRRKMSVSDQYVLLEKSNDGRTTAPETQPPQDWKTESKGVEDFVEFHSTQNSENDSSTTKTVRSGKTEETQETKSGKTEETQETKESEELKEHEQWRKVHGEKTAPGLPKAKKKCPKKPILIIAAVGTVLVVGITVALVLALVVFKSKKEPDEKTTSQSTTTRETTASTMERVKYFTGTTVTIANTGTTLETRTTESGAKTTYAAPISATVTNAMESTTAKTGLPYQPRSPMRWNQQHRTTEKGRQSLKKEERPWKLLQQN